MTYMQEAVQAWVWTEGQYYPDRAWLLSNMDTWVANPHYRGPAQAHPEDWVDDTEA